MYKALMTRLPLAILLVTVLGSCGSFNKPTTLDPSTGKFPAKIKTVSVLKSKPIAMDTLRSLIIVADDPYWIAMVNNMKFFDRVVTYPQFQKEIIAAGLTDKIPNVSDRIGLRNAYLHYKPFTILNLTKVQKPGKGWYAGLTLYDPNSAETVFQNEIHLNLMWDGWTDQGTMYPLFNSLLDYLNGK